MTLVEATDTKRRLDMSSRFAIIHQPAVCKSNNVQRSDNNDTADNISLIDVSALSIVKVLFKLLQSMHC